MRVFIVLICAVVVGSLGLAWIEARSVRATETSLQTIAENSANLGAKVRTFEAKILAADRDQAKLQAKLDGLHATRPEAATPTAAVTSSSFHKGNPMEFIQKNPKLQALFLNSQRVDLATRYGPLFQKLQLTPEQIAKFEDIVIMNREQNMDLDAVKQSQGLKESDPAVAALQQQAEDQLMSAQADLLGEAKYQQFQQYEQTMPAREIVSQFAGASALSGIPLNAQQAEQLTQVMARQSAQSQSSKTVDPATIDWEAVDEQAKAFLSQQQLALFKRVEPIGGGPSRWMAQLEAAMGQAEPSNSH